MRLILIVTLAKIIGNYFGTLPEPKTRKSLVFDTARVYAGTQSLVEEKLF